MELDKRTRPKCLVGISIAVASLLLTPCAPVGAGTSFGVNNVLQVAAGGSMSENCTSLRDVLSSIDDSSLFKPYLVRLEPGVYDCGDTSVIVGAHITLEGAGRNNTLIIGAVDSSILGVLHLNGSRSGVRSLTVRNGTKASDQAAPAISMGTVRSNEGIGGIVLEEITAASSKGSLSVYSNSAVYQAWNSIFEDPLHAESGSARLRFSELWAVGGTGTFQCDLCAHPTGSLLDTSCLP